MQMKKTGQFNKVEKERLHPRNQHRLPYNFNELIKFTPELAAHVFFNEFGNQSINFSDAESVKLLNRALLKQFYKIEYWDIPANYLCPPIPGRVDYIHYLADLLAEHNEGIVPRGKTIKGLDIGVGANCIYPILGNSEYGWSFVGSDISRDAIKSARNIVSINPSLTKFIDCRLQQASGNIFKGIVKPGEQFDFSISNPPFHNSREQASAGTLRKNKNLGNLTGGGQILNFGGKSAELWCELVFVRKMIEESVAFADNFLWFTTLVSKKEHLKPLYSNLHYFKAFDVRTISMSQGQKVSRILAWTFKSKTQQTEWAKKHNWAKISGDLAEIKGKPQK